MFFDEETNHWQDEYKKGNLDDEEMPGEIHALLDGSAEKEFKRMLKFLGAFVVAAIVGFIIIHISSTQKSGEEEIMNITEEETDFMRADLESGMGYSRIIEATRKRFEEEGRDFDAELKEFKEKRKRDRVAQLLILAANRA